MSSAAPVRLHGAPNLRDLGGRRTADGRVVRFGRLYRSGALSTLTDADVTTLAGLGLRTVVDFRLAAEVSDGGADRLPPGLSPLSLPVGGGSLDGFYALAKSGDFGRAEAVLGDGRAAESMARMYRGFTANDDERAGFAAALATIGESDRLPLLFHCTAGKDRAGWLAAVLLRILGVPDEDVMADFLLSNQYFLPVADGQLGALGFAPEQLAVFQPMLEQRPEYLAAAFAEAEERYGSFEEFIHKGLDFPATAVAGLRDRLLETASG